MKKSANKNFTLDGPLLDKASFRLDPNVNFTEFPFSLNIIKNLKSIEFKTQVTFFVGENGTGKSTILEAIADKIGFGAEGGSKNINFKTSYENTYKATELLSKYLTLSWRMKPTDGYFFRAESFYNVANYIDYLALECGGNAYNSYGGKSLHAQSHGESFLSFFKNRIGKSGLFILDEPEAALSPQRQLTLLSIINQMCKANSQFIIATHSPIILAYPQATIYSCDSDFLKTISYTDTEHYKITKNFLDNPSLFLHHLFHD